MSRDRLLHLTEYLDVVENSSQPNRNDSNFDRAFKVRHLLDIAKENFRTTGKEEKLSVDEQIMLFKGRSVMKQHMPKKPNRWGYKMFILTGGKSDARAEFCALNGRTFYVITNDSFKNLAKVLFDAGCSSYKS
ncbi:unnamed protein product [Adineta steineri]|uniref:PiggyBac transposable element-derived protein domain-containing protein n=1 Tax=Adineta steineri TaxID=433720 RepID=A0A815UD43_9BILA|nr:unnamed protein product [Adineta steineri]